MCGRTVLFVSHNMPAVARLCYRAILLKERPIDARLSGDVWVVAHYLHTRVRRGLDPLPRTIRDGTLALGREAARGQSRR